LEDYQGGRDEKRKKKFIPSLISSQNTLDIDDRGEEWKISNRELIEFFSFASSPSGAASGNLIDELE
jgi:hypothetical protein